MFQYFLKVVSTQFRTLDDKAVSTAVLSCSPPLLRYAQINTHQYSVTHFERDLSQLGNEDKQGVYTQHNTMGLPGMETDCISALQMPMGIQAHSSILRYLRSSSSIRKRGNRLRISLHRTCLSMLCCN